MKKILILLFFSSIAMVSNAQMKIGDNILNIGENSLLELESTNKALVLPVISSVSNITVPQNGMLIYDDTKKCIRGYANGVWTECFSFVNPPVLDSSGKLIPNQSSEVKQNVPVK